MRILIASDAFPPKIDGVSDTAAMVCRLLGERGHELWAVAPGPGPARVHGATVARLPSVRAPFYPELGLAYRFGPLRALLRERPPDAAIVFTPGPAGLQTARLLPAATPLTHVYTTDIARYMRAYRMGVLAGLYDRVLRWLCGRATVTLCPTAHVRDELARRHMPRLEVWGRGVDGELFKPGRRSAEGRAALGGDADARPIVLYAGRLAREKRLADLAAAAHALPGLRFALVGDGPERARLEALFPADRTVFTGYLRGEPLAAAFASADVFAFPSDTDTFGQVVLQAMASGLPPVVVADSAPADFVPDGVAGLHVAPRSPRELASALRLLGEDARLRRELGAAALAESARHSWPVLVGQLERLLQPAAAPASHAHEPSP